MVQMFDLYLNQQTWISFVFIRVACVANSIYRDQYRLCVVSTATVPKHLDRNQPNFHISFYRTRRCEIAIFYFFFIFYHTNFYDFSKKGNLKCCAMGTGTPVIHNLWLTAQRSTQYISFVCGYWSCASFLFILFATWISGVPHSQTLIFNVAQGKCTSLVPNFFKTIQHSLVFLLIRWFDLSTTLFIDTTEICYFLCMYFTVNDCNFINVSIK